MTEYDVVVVGGGTGNNVAAAAADAGLETALVEPGPLGGTCLNRGCNPSKMLLQAANAANDVRAAEKFHVEATLESVDHAAVVDEMDELLGGIADGMADGYREKDHLTLYDAYATFVDDHTLDVDGERITGERVVVATGSRPLVPPIDGLDDVDYMTSQDALYRRDLPDSLVVLGGGYIAVELGYYLESMGVDVTVVEMLDSLVPREDPAVSAEFTEIARDRHEVYTGHRVTAVESAGENGVHVHAETEDGDRATFAADDVLVALGRRPNTDDIGLDETSIEVDDDGFVETNEYLETTADGVWAQGDVAGNAMFKHSGDYETEHTVRNVVHDERASVNLDALPHVIFTDPQVAGVGATEAELEDSDVDFAVGRADYADSSMGRAKKLEHGFVKVLAAPDGEILGAHALGYEASTLVHELVVAMRNDVSVAAMADTIHAHPSLNKIVERAFDDLTS